MLEKALSDPREYERRFIKKGMEIASNQVGLICEKATPLPPLPCRSFRSLPSHNNVPAQETGESLAAELAGASRDELMAKVEKLGNDCRALRAYIDKLLAVVIERIPDILEVK